jgi:two-component system chemotaxis response regulator CheY
MSAKRVLVVDDAVVMRRMIGRMLAEHGFEVCGEATNGAEAVDRYKALAPDFVTMDLIMPEADGLHAVQEIISHDPAARIIMCASTKQRSLVAEALAAGAKAFVTKPFRAPEMIDAIGTLFAEAKL